MYIPKIGLTHIFREVLQNFQGERLSKFTVFAKKECHIFCLCEKPALKFHQMTIPPDLLATEFAKKPFSVRHYLYWPLNPVFRSTGPQRPRSAARVGSVFSGGNPAARHGVTVPLVNSYDSRKPARSSVLRGFAIGGDFFFNKKATNPILGVAFSQTTTHLSPTASSKLRGFLLWGIQLNTVIGFSDGEKVPIYQCITGVVRLAKVLLSDPSDSAT